MENLNSALNGVWRGEANSKQAAIKAFMSAVL